MHIGMMGVDRWRHMQRVNICTVSTNIWGIHIPWFLLPIPISTLVPIPISTLVPIPISTLVPIPISTLVPISISILVPIPISTLVPIPISILVPIPIIIIYINCLQCSLLLKNFILVLKVNNLI